MPVPNDLGLGVETMAGLLIAVIDILNGLGLAGVRFDDGVNGRFCFFDAVVLVGEQGL